MGLILGTHQLAASLTQPNEPSHSKAPIRVALLSLPPRTYSLLEFFFNHAGRGSFVVSAEDSAETAIFDLDTQASTLHWQAFRARTGYFGLALAVRPQEVPGALWVQKPVTPAALLAAAANLRALQFRATLAPSAPAAAATPVEMPGRDGTETPAVESLVQIKLVEPRTDPTSPERAAAASASSAASSAEGSADSHRRSPAAAAVSETEATAQTRRTAKADVEPVPAQPTQQAQHSQQTERLDSAETAPSANSMAASRREREKATRPAASKSFWTRVFGGTLQDIPAERATAKTPLPSQPSPADLRPPESARPKADDATAAVMDSMAVAADLRSTEPEKLLQHRADSGAVQVPIDTTVVTPPDAISPPPSAPPVTGDIEAHTSMIESAGADAVASVRKPETSQSKDGVLAIASADEACYFGSMSDATATQWRDEATRQYDPSAYLVGLLREAFQVSSKWQVATQLEADGAILVLDAARNLIYASVDSASFDRLAGAVLGTKSKVRTLTSGEFELFMASSNGASQPLCMRLDDTLWRSAMLAAAGRLPQGTDPQRTCYLKQWPNLTRITALPQAARLTALWALKGSSVMDSSQYKIEQRHVVGFYNGAWALNLLTDDGSLARRVQRKGARNRGLLSRLLGWLRT